jgi:signal transduction histidine kinase
VLELRHCVRVITASIGLCAVLTATSLVGITSYLHRLTNQVDANLQSVRAAEEIELQLLFHARNVNQANLLSAPERRSIAAQAQAEVLRWLDSARRYVGSAEEAEVLATLEADLDVYFAEQAELLDEELPALERYVLAAGLLDRAFAQAEELLRINVEQAAVATARSATWDRIASAVGFSVATALLVLTAALILGAHLLVYRPLLGLGEAIRRYDARRRTAGRLEETGPAEIRAIARAFNEMAEEIERQRSQQLVFVASVAHDLRNPLAAMKAAVTASAGAGKTLPHGTLMPLMSRQIDALARMITDLLDAARIESGQFALTFAEHDARELVCDSVALFREVAPLHQLAAITPAAPLKLRCDGARVSQVINNLLSNAIKYSPEGGPIETRAGARAHGVVIEVADRGIGIPEDEQAAIFEPFRRGRALGAAIPGVGIGLSVARRIVEAHGGSLSVRSSVATGSTFSVWLPASTAAPAPSARIARELPAAVR